MDKGYLVDLQEACVEGKWEYVAPQVGVGADGIARWVLPRLEAVAMHHVVHLKEASRRWNRNMILYKFEKLLTEFFAFGQIQAYQTIFPKN